MQRIQSMELPRPTTSLPLIPYVENDHELYCKCPKCKGNNEGVMDMQPIRSIISPAAIRRAEPLPNRESHRNLAKYVEAMRQINAPNSNVQNPNALRANVGEQVEQKSDPNGTTRFVVNHHSRQRANVNKIIAALQKKNRSRPAWAQPPVLTFKTKQNEPGQNVFQPPIKKTPSEQHAAVYGFNKSGRKLGGTRRKQRKQRKTRRSKK
jgi:hypothetical protein